MGQEKTWIQPVGNREYLKIPYSLGSKLGHPEVESLGRTYINPFSTAPVCIPVPWSVWAWHKGRQVTVTGGLMAA